MPDQHAVLGPSKAHRWLRCTASIALEETLPVPPTSEAAKEGSLAHAMAEDKLRAWLNSGESLSGCSPEPEMDEATDAYVDLVKTIANDLHGTVAVEQHLDLGHIIPGGFGKADAVIIGGEVLHVVDLKYGRGVRVEAEGNPQLRLYALGALAAFEPLYDVETVRMTIVQPRLDAVSTAEMSRTDLEEWGRTVVAPAAKAALDGTGVFRAGDWCRWCRAKAICRARAEENLALARREMAPAPALTPEELADVITRGRRLAAWVKDVEEHATAALTAGEGVPGLKLVAGRGRRVFTDAEAAADAAEKAGYVSRETRPLPLSAIEKAMGRKRFAEVLGDLVTKTEGVPLLVAASDPRPAWEPVTPQSEFTKEN